MLRRLAPVHRATRRAMRMLLLCGGLALAAPLAPARLARVAVPPAAPLQQAGAEAARAADDVAPSADEQRARARILAIARAYAEHRWTASAANVLHGADAGGVHVDTPDASVRPDGWHADGRENQGVPYKWGGFSSLDEFDAAVAAGAPAGQLTDGVKLDASAVAVGVDCSGFVARCWDLPVKQSTRSLGRLCFELDDFAELRPGDLINKFDAHAMVFVEFADEARTQVRVVEATLPRVLENVHGLRALERSGYRPYRYKPLDARWVEVEPAPAAQARPAGTVGFRADPARAAVEAREASQLPRLRETLAGLTDRLPLARPGDWLRYELESGPRGPVTLKTRSVARSTDGGVLVQASLVQDGRRLQTQELQPASADVLQRLLAWQESGQPYEDLELVGGRVVFGEASLGEQRLPATQLELDFAAALTMRGRRYAVDVRLRALLSEALPLEGVLSLSRDVSYHLDGSTPRGRAAFRLLAWGASRPDG